MKTPLLLALALLAASTPLPAQDSAPRWRVVPRVGSFFGDTNDGLILQGGSDAQPRTAGLDQGAVIGIGLDFDTPLWWLGFRLNADRTIGAEATFFRTPPCLGQACPDILREAITSDAKVTALSLDMRIQPAPRQWAVRPFVTAGFDRLRVDLDEEQPLDEVRPALHFGFGVDVDVAGLPLRMEGTHRSFYQAGDSQRQGHYLIVGGVRIPID